MTSMKMSNPRARYYFLLGSRIFEIAAVVLFLYWAYTAWWIQPWYYTTLNLFAAATNGLSFYMAMRRNAAQFIYRSNLRCPICGSNSFFVIDVQRFKRSKRSQCAFAQCTSCDSTSVYSCKCTPERCEHRVECLAIPTHHIPFFYPLEWKPIAIR
jgi:hypothetical protein